MLIPINSNYYDEGRIYSSNVVDLQPGFTVLVGCNGSGKTTLLRQIEQWCKKNDMPCFKFDNYHNGGHVMNNMLLNCYGDTEALISNVCSSEGEQISNNMAMVAGQIGRFMQKQVILNGKKQVVVLFDAIDSGLSVDNVIEVKQDLIKTIIKDCSQRDGIEVFIVASANEYELARGEQCLNMTNLKYVPIKTYNAFRKLIVKSRKRKNKRYKWGDWTYDIT